MSLGQLGVGVVVLVIAVFVLPTGGANTPETSVPADDIDRGIGVDVAEPGADSAPPEDPDPGAEQEPVVTDDDRTDDPGDGGVVNENGSESETFEAVETDDSDAGPPTRTTRPCGSPVSVSDYNDGGGDDGSSNNSFSDDSTDDSSTDDSTGDMFSGDSTGDAGDDTGDGSGDDLNDGGSDDDIGICTV